MEFAPRPACRLTVSRDYHGGMFEPPPLTRPGLFVTATDTGVGKTVVSCAIAAAWNARHRHRSPTTTPPPTDTRAADQADPAGVAGRAGRGGLGVCKPFGSGCRLDRRGVLVHEDAEALVGVSGFGLPLEVVNPLRYAAPLAPGVAAEAEGRPVAWDRLSQSLAAIDRVCDAVLVEGVGGIMVPLDPRYPRFMVAQLARAIGYPVLVVCRPDLGTLNHTAMTVELLRQAGCRVSGLVINGVDPDPAALRRDPSLRTNAAWLERLTGAKVLAKLPRGRAVSPENLARGQIDPALVAAADRVDWAEVMRRPGE